MEEPFDRVYVNQDGTVREVSPKERHHLSQKFAPGDGSRPYRAVLKLFGACNWNAKRSEKASRGTLIRARTYPKTRRGRVASRF